MDIDLLSKMVKELILDKDEVDLPGVGSFVTEIVPATFSDKGYTINPPYRRLFFRQRQNDSDTTLAEMYAKNNDVDLGQAVRIVEDFLEEMKDVLKQKKTIIFPGLGRLRATRENNFFFVADEDLDIYPDGFGLEPISLKTHEETPEEVSAAISDLKGILDEHKEDEPIAIEDLQIDQETAPAAETAPETAPEPVKTEEEKAEEVKPAEPETIEKSLPEKKSSRKTLLWILASLAIIAVVALIIFAILGRVAPDIVDSWLYSAEDLEFLRSLK